MSRLSHKDLLEKFSNSFELNGYTPEQIRVCCEFLFKYVNFTIGNHDSACEFRLKYLGLFKIPKSLAKKGVEGMESGKLELKGPVAESFREKYNLLVKHLKNIENYEYYR